MTSVIALVAVLLAVFPLCLFTALVGRQARRASVGAAWYWCLVASWLGGVGVGSAGLTAAVIYLSKSGEVADSVYYLLLFLTGPLGGSVGPGLIWLYLRGRRTHDADYGDYPRN